MGRVSGDTLVEASADMGVIDDVFSSTAGHLNAQHARLVSAVVWMLDHVREWQGDGLWTPEAYVRWRTGVSQATATKIVAVAKRAAEFPHCIDAMQRGELSLDQIAPVAKHAPGWCDQQMAGLAPRLTVAQITKTARQYPWNYDLSPTAQGAEAKADVTEEGLDDNPNDKSAPAPADEAWYGWDDNGRFRLQANLGHDTGSIIETALTQARDVLFSAGTPDNDTADALIEIAERSLDSIESPERRSRYRINFHMTEEGDVTDSRGRPVPNAAADCITCNALVSPVKFVNGVPVSVGRSQHIVPDRTRRLVEHRDQGCRVPGCSSDRYVEVHHIIHWSHNGPTDTWNLICLCPKHHRLHHQGRLGITGNSDRQHGAAGEVEFTDASGKILTESGARPWPPGALPPPIQGTYEHPIGERLDFRWLHFNNDPQRPQPLGGPHASQTQQPSNHDGTAHDAA